MLRLGPHRFRSVRLVLALLGASLFIIGCDLGATGSRSCTDEMDCLPGETCFASKCNAPRRLSLTISGCDDCSSLKVWVIVTPRDVSYPEISASGRSRLVAERNSPDSYTDSRAFFYIEDLPRLKTHLLVWEGTEASAVGGDSFALSSVPEMFNIEMNIGTTGTWRWEPAEKPPRLSMEDWDIFAEL